jgi:hypothetical protein
VGEVGGHAFFEEDAERFPEVVINFGLFLGNHFQMIIFLILTKIFLYL